MNSCLLFFVKWRLCTAKTILPLDQGHKKAFRLKLNLKKVTKRMAKGTWATKTGEILTKIQHQENREHSRKRTNSTNYNQQQKGDKEEKHLLRKTMAISLKENNNHRLTASAVLPTGALAYRFDRHVCELWRLRRFCRTLLRTQSGAYTHHWHGSFSRHEDRHVQQKIL